MERNRRPPSDVEEALSSMLWTPYPCTPSISSDEEIDNENSHKSNAKDKDQHLFVIDQCESSINHNNNNNYNNNYNNNNNNNNYNNYNSNNNNNNGLISKFKPKSWNPINGQLPSYDFIENERHIKHFKEIFFGTKNVSQTNVNYDRSSSLTGNPNDIYVIQSSEWNTMSMVQPNLGDSSLHQILNANAENPLSNNSNMLNIQISDQNNGNSMASQNQNQSNNNLIFVKNSSMNQSNILPSVSFDHQIMDTMQTPSIPNEHTDAIRYHDTSSMVKKYMCIEKDARCSCNVQNHCKNLPERVTQLQHTNINGSQLHTHLDENVAIRAHNKVIYNKDEMNRVGDDDRLNSTTAPTTKMMKIETTTTTTTETVNIELKQRQFSRDRLFHASVSSKAHAFFDFLKFSRNSESIVPNLTNFNRSSSVNNCAIAAMQLNVPNEDHSAVAVTDPFKNSSTRISHIDNNNAVNIVSSSSNLIIPISAGGPSTTVNTETIKTVAPSSSQIFENGILIGAIVEQPSLTIQINQSNHNQQFEQSQQINEERTQQVRFVSCRAIPMQAVNNGNSDLHSQQKKNNIIICESDNAKNNSTSDHIISNQIKINSSSRTSDKSENCDKIVLINETEKQSEYVNYNSEHINEDKTNNSSTIQIGNLKRIYVSTEAQTDELQQPTSTNNHNIHNFETTNTITPANDAIRIIDSLIKDDHTNSSQMKSGQAHSRRRNDIESQLAREQRRRERRRPHSSRQHHNHPSNQAISMQHSRNVECEVLPDILHNHVPPPYTTLPLTPHCPITGASVLTQTAPQSVTRPPPPPPPPSALIPVGISDVGRFTYPLPIIRRSPSERSGKDCCGQWFAGPPLRAVIAVVALGGVACSLGGAALGATGLAGPPTSHLTAALLMIGVGVILVSVSAAAWRMTAPGSTQCLGIGSSELGRCGRRTGCTGRLPQFLYPEFQHRPPPPTYQASMQEYRLRLLLLHRDRQVHRNNASPPPTYRSHAGTLLRAPLSVRGHSGAHSSECSLPPSYRSRNNLLRIPALISGSCTGNANQNRINSNRETNSKQSKSANTNIQEIDQLYLNTNSSSSHGPVTDESNRKSVDTSNDNNDLVTIVSITDCTANGTTNSEMDILAHL